MMGPLGRTVAGAPGQAAVNALMVAKSTGNGAWLMAVHCELPNYLVLAQVSERRGKPVWRRRWKSSTSKG